ncbi:RloB family protein [Microcoleus sp. OTE_8_concoct_300]|uniref:RloB family protein n=1 Tax=Microcoleus sp. OTE_8_concoct_300 TaxID=2964710 RepID=UPI00403F4F6F
MSRQTKRKLKQLKQSIYIVCEGTNTEPIYFEAIAQENDVFDNYAITVYPSEEDQIKASKKEGESIKTDAVNLVKLAKQEIKNYDEVWAVFDKDGYTKHEKAFSDAQKHGIKLGFSSIAFEHWILLHYEQNRKAFDKSQNVITYLEQAGYFTGYSKKADISIYPRLKDLTQTAIENAAWLRMEMAKDLAACDKKIYELNPYTTVDELVIKLLGFNPVTYGYITETLRISDFSITVNDVQRHCGITLSVCIVNHGKCSYLVNNLCDHFYLKDEKQNKFQLVIDTPIIIEPSSTQDIALKCEKFSATGKLRLHFSPEPNKILIIALHNITDIMSD